MKILLGSNNKHKAKEIYQIFQREFAGMVELITPEAVLYEIPEIEETGLTLEENAYIKAKAFYELTGVPSFSDDTGLEIEALGGAPGVKSARFAGSPPSDAMNRKKALQLLNNIPPEKRTAQFRTVICFYDGKKAEYIDGACNGRLIDEERGTNGFGYDSIFMPDGFTQTFAEMAVEQKNMLSHRGKAIINLITFLKTKI